MLTAFTLFFPATHNFWHNQMFGIPQPSPYDLNFRLVGIPVRITPVFWIMSIVLGWGNGEPTEVAIWVGCVLISIIVHEMGHALTNRLFGLRSVIVLHGLGGVCGSEDKPISSWKRILVLFNGPAAGFILAALVYALLRAGLQGMLPAAININSPVQKEIINNLLTINIFWGLLNLIPIWPLDGGQIMGVLLKKISRWRGQEFMHGLSMLVAAGLGVWLYQRNGDVYNIFLLGLIAMQNFQMLQFLHARQTQFTEEDDQWWRR